MSDQELRRRIAKSESIHDQLVTELEALDRLLKATGFPEGVSSVREVAEEMLIDDVE